MDQRLLRHRKDHYSVRCQNLLGSSRANVIARSHRILSELRELEAIQLPEEPLRVIPYFCSGRVTDDKKPTYETVIRAIACKLSWMPDFSVAQPAKELYNRRTQGYETQASHDEWVKLLDDLLTGDSKVVILVDALDAISTDHDGELFLEHMEKVIKDHPQIYFLFSSHANVRVQHYFSPDVLLEVEVKPTATVGDMVEFIKAKIEFRKPKEKDSIFCSYRIHVYCQKSATC
jgi:hypothetical protein